jgi:hypothetical protein
MRFAKAVFWLASAWGIGILLPLYFRIDAIGRAAPPPITHPEFYYGFLGLALVWQIAFIAIAIDPLRFRPLIPVAVLEKFSFAATVSVLYIQGRIAFGDVMLGAAADTVLGALFAAAFVATRSVNRAEASARQY